MMVGTGVGLAEGLAYAMPAKNDLKARKRDVLSIFVLPAPTIPRALVVFVFRAERACFVLSVRREVCRRFLAEY